jgi:6-phosphofructokinase 1
MAKPSKTKCIGILTSGGDCPGLNAAIRGVTKAAMGEFDIKVIGIRDGFRGLVENRWINMDSELVSGILTRGGTLLGTSRDKPNKMPMGGKTMDMTAVAVENVKRLQLDCLVCLGGGGTVKNAFHLMKEGGINVMSLPKTIDNDIAGTDITFGFDTAMNIATEAIDRLHSTAESHHRIIVVEIMGHNAGWLALGAGIAGGADVILIPELPYDLDKVAQHLIGRRHRGKRFSIIALSEGAISREDALAQEREGKKEKKVSPETAPDVVPGPRLIQEPMSNRLARRLQELTSMEARVTTLGHIVRGGSPSPADRLLCTRLGTKAAQLLAEGVYNVMVGVKADQVVPVPIEQVAGFKKFVPQDHPWIETARLEGTCMGD